MRRRGVLSLLVIVTGSLSCEAEGRHEIETLSAQSRFYYGFAYAGHPPEGASLVVASRSSCSDRGEEADKHFSFLLNSTLAGHYTDVMSVKLDDFFKDPDSLVADIDIPIVVHDSRVINYGLEDGSITILGSVGDGNRSQPSTLYARVSATLDDSDYVAVSCDGEVGPDLELISYSCTCVRADGKSATCNAEKKEGEDSAVQDCCWLLNTGSEPQMVEFNFSAEYCSTMCQDIGNGLAKTMCLPSMR